MGLELEMCSNKILKTVLALDFVNKSLVMHIPEGHSLHFHVQDQCNL